MEDLTTFFQGTFYTFFREGNMVYFLKITLHSQETERVSSYGSEYTTYACMLFVMACKCFHYYFKFSWRNVIIETLARAFSF